MDAQQPDNGACLSHNPRKNFFLSVNYLTLLDRFRKMLLKDDGSGRLSRECRLTS